MTAAAGEELAPTPLRNPFQPASPFGFRPPEGEETSSHATIPNPASSPEATTPADELDQDSGDDWLHDDASPASRPGTSSTASATRGAVDNPLNGEGLRDTFRNAVIIASAQAHTYIGSRTEGMRAVGLYQAEEEDAERIADPLARIAGRRDALGAVSPDTADLMAAMMGLAGYATKQIQKQAIAKKLDAQLAAGQVVPDGAGEAVTS